MHRKEKTASGRRISAAELGFPTPKNYFCRVENRFVNIHTHRPQADELTISTRGLHPWEAERTEWPASEAFADVQAVGEIGLDLARPVDRVRQTELLRMQLRSAEQLGKPVVLHCVRAFEPLMRVLEEYRLRAVIFHGFIGSPEQAAHALKRGYYLSFGERRCCGRCRPTGSFWRRTRAKRPLPRSTAGPPVCATRRPGSSDES